MGVNSFERSEVIATLAVGVEYIIMRRYAVFFLFVVVSGAGQGHSKLFLALALFRRKDSSTISILKKRTTIVLKPIWVYDGNDASMFYLC